jgi:acyl-CoA synthetase (AMP-forming)/AMP-acid ligase II
MLGAALGLAPVLLREAGAQPKNAAWPKALNMGTAAPGGTYALYGPAWGQLVQEATGINISYRTTQGPNQNIVLVNTREVEIGMVTMGVALQAWNGDGAWTQGRKFQDIRALFPMYDTPFHGIALKKSGITRMAQLSGKNIGVGPRGGTPGIFEDGFLFIVDRKKDMILSGGENIYSWEVEEALRRHPSVAEVAVIAVPDEEWGEAVKACVVLNPGASADESGLITFCREQIASYKKPRSIDFVAELPRLFNGKVDKKALRAPYWAGKDRQVS